MEACTMHAQCLIADLSRRKPLAGVADINSETAELRTGLAPPEEYT